MSNIKSMMAKWLATPKTKHNTVTIAVAGITATTTVVLSMVLNTWAFTKVNNGWFGHALGILLPLWVLAATYMGHQSKGYISYGSYVLAAFALIVSLPHLAHGYGELGLNNVEMWCLAIITDVTQVVAKLLIITSLEPEHKSKPESKPQATKGKKKQPVKIAA